MNEKDKAAINNSMANSLPLVKKQELAQELNWRFKMMNGHNNPSFEYVMNPDENIDIFDDFYNTMSTCCEDYAYRHVYSGIEPDMDVKTAMQNLVSSDMTARAHAEESYCTYVYKLAEKEAVPLMMEQLSDTNIPNIGKLRKEMLMDDIEKANGDATLDSAISAVNTFKEAVREVPEFRANASKAVSLPNVLDAIATQVYEDLGYRRPQPEALKGYVRQEVEMYLPKDLALGYAKEAMKERHEHNIAIFGELTANRLRECTGIVVDGNRVSVFDERDVPKACEIFKCKPGRLLETIRKRANEKVEMKLAELGFEHERGE